MGVELRHYLIPRPNSFRPSAEQLSDLIGSLVANRWIHDPADPSSSSPVRGDEGSPPDLAEKWGAYARVRRNVRTGDDFPGVAIPFPLTPSWLEQRLGGNLVLVWPVETFPDSGVRYPLRPCELKADLIYYELQIHLCPDFVYHLSELIQPFRAASGASQGHGNKASVAGGSYGESGQEVRCNCGQVLEYAPEPDHDVFYAFRIHSTCPRCGRPFDPGDLSAAVRDGWTGEVIGEVPGGATYRFAIVVDCGKCLPAWNKRIEVEPDFLAVCRNRLGCDLYQLTDLY